MFPARPLLHAVRITLFHRTNCGLCHQAKSVLSNVWDKRHFDYTEVDLTKSEQWRNLYDFDIPVIHIAKTGAPEEQVSAAGEAIKLMHRFTEEQVETKMDQAETS